MQQRLAFSSYVAVGVMLFALFFGAGNLIFPATLGQYSGENFIPAIGGFLITGIGMPFLGVLAIGYSGSSNLQDLANRIHPVYALIFTALLYLTIGPFFAAPRTGAVAYDIGISPFISENYHDLGLFIFTFLFFAVTLWLSLNPTKIVDRVGKLLSPAIVILLAVLLFMAFTNPISPIDIAHEGYLTKAHAFFTGFTEGYNTMDALAALVFGIIVIESIERFGASNRKEVLGATFKSGIIATILLGVIYIGIAYLGATTTGAFGLFETGGTVLNKASIHYFGTTGLVLLAVIIILACLTTSIGLITACAGYFNTLIPTISYKMFAVIFSTFCFIIANFGLANIIKYSLPVLMFLYPLAIVLVLLTFLSPLFNHSRLVYVSTTVITFAISIVDGVKTLYKELNIPFFNLLEKIIAFYEKTLPLYNDGLGWLIPALIVIIITGMIARIIKK